MHWRPMWFAGYADAPQEGQACVARVAASAEDQESLLRKCRRRVRQRPLPQYRFKRNRPSTPKVSLADSVHSSVAPDDGTNIR